MPRIPTVGAHVAPLLVKELIELAARPRSYLVRALFACGIFALYALQFHAQLAGAEAGDLAVLGSGKRMLDSLVGELFAAIYLLVPAMVAPAVLAEREAGTLEVLLVSRLLPWQLLAQKLLSRAVAMLGFIILALPLFGIAYSLGGLGVGDVAAAAAALISGTLQVGAWSLYCGARARSGMAGVIRTYVLGIAALFILVPLALVPLQIVAALTHLDLGWASSYPMGIYYGESGTSLWRLPLSCLPTLLSAAVLFLMACRALEFDERWWAPHVAPRIPARELRARAVSGELPNEGPVAWRETVRIRRWLRQGQAWLALAALGALIMLALIAMARQGDFSAESDATAVLAVLGLIVAVATVGAQASSLATSERARGTLEILLTTPLSPREIVRQKIAGARLIARIAVAAIAATCVAEAVLEIGFGLDRAFVYLLASTATAWVYLECAAWLGMTVGLHARSPTAAAATTIAIMLAWGFIPPILVDALGPPGAGDSVLGLLSPMAMVAMDERPSVGPASWLGLLAVNSAWYAAVAFGLRWWCLWAADRRLQARQGG